MTNRETVFAALTGSTDLVALVGDRIHAASSLKNVPTTPFITFRMHHTLEVQGRIGKRQHVTIWAHDEPGDYMRIDDMIAAIDAAMEAILPTGTLREVRWIEGSPDLQDDDMGTITRNTRFEMTSSTPERHT